MNHSVNFVDPATGAHTNNIEGTWRHAKASMNKYCTKKIFFSGYLAKYMFLKVCRTDKRDPTKFFFELAALVYDPNAPRVDIDVTAEEEESEPEDDPDGFFEDLQ